MSLIEAYIAEAKKLLNPGKNKISHEETEQIIKMLLQDVNLDPRHQNNMAIRYASRYGHTIC
jgi:hypothetical protein